MNRLPHSHFKIFCCLLVLASGFFGAASLSRVASKSYTSKAPSNLAAQKINGYATDLSVEIPDKARINLTGGHALLTTYVGKSAAAEALRENRVEALALTSEDFDEDGVKDIIAAYALNDGGIITLQRGNRDAIYPNAPEAQQRKAVGEFTDAAFFAQAQVFELSQRPDFVGAGDFDADGHQDVVVATAKDYRLTFLLGDGRGNFSSTQTVDLPGVVTALECAEVNRRDGLVDIVVGIVGSDGTKALVFAAPDGAMRAVAESINLPSEANAFAMANLDSEYPIDLIIATGKGLFLVKGLDRSLSLYREAQMPVTPMRINRRLFEKNIRSVIEGDFSRAQGRELALLTDDGSVMIIEKPAINKRSSRNIKQIAKAYFPTATRLIGVRVSNEQTENLLALDAAKQQVHILSPDKISQGKKGSNRDPQVDSPTVTQMNVEGEPVAVLPMRLNADGLSDLVILRRGESAITVTPSAPQAIFQVINVEDAGVGSLREAIMMANATGAPDEIIFNIGGSGRTINLLSPLPAITNSLTIDATTQPGFTGVPIVELNYNAAGTAQGGLVINAPSCAIRGLVINRVQGASPAGNGIQINNSEAMIEGNFIGTNLAGNAASPNGGFGIDIENSNSITIGGTTAAARNVISGNLSDGIHITGPMSDLVEVAGNFIGTNGAGTASLTISDGIRIAGSPTNITIGGTTPASRNLISGNLSGVIIETMSDGNLVQGNFIGVDVTGTLDLGNNEIGVRVTASVGNLIGGAVNGARNVICGNKNVGVFFNGASNNLIQNNFIGINLNGTAVPNNNGVVIVGNADNNTIGGPGAGNIIAFNTITGVAVLGALNNAILANSIFSNGGLGINLSDDQVTPNDVGDVDTGANNLQNFPVLTSATQEAGGTRVQGTLPSMLATSYRIEFFSSPDCDTSGNGEGQNFIGSTMVITNNVDGMGDFDVLLPPVPVGQVITATATDPANNTSEFSQCVTVLAAAGSADLSITKTAAPTQVLAGTLLTYTLTIRNLGPGLAANVALNEFTPANTVFRSLNAPAGWTCSTPAQGAVGNITCTNPALTVGEVQVFTLVVRVNSTTPNGTPVRNTAKVTSTTPDLNLLNNAASTTVTAINNCILNCTLNITRNIDANQCGAAVNYPPAIASGSCGAVTCTPASGTFFQRGATVVNCSTNSGLACSFTITVNDNQTPTISCPVNVIALDNPTGSGMAVVNYPLPMTTDNCQGVTTLCAPPAGSVFPVGITTVTCAATDAAGNSASCSFNVTVQGGQPNLLVTIPGGKANLEFGSISPVPARRKPAKEKNNPCSIFTVENRGFTPVEIILDSLLRTGADVDSQRISNANEGDLYSVRRINVDGGEVAVPISGRVVIGIGEQVNFCVKFNPLLPMVTTSTTGIAATLALPDRITSKVNFRVTGGNAFSVNIIANVANELVLIDPINTRRKPVVAFERVADEYVLTFSLFDANLDVQRMKVELLDSGGNVVAEFDIDLIVPIRERNLVRGQSFTVVQKFSGANDNPQINAARVTVRDAQTTVSGGANLSNSSAPGSFVSASQIESVVQLPGVQIRK